MSSQDRHFVALAALGRDRAGLVAEVSAHVSGLGGNVEDSRMAILGAEFGILLLVSGSEDAVAAIEGDLPALSRSTGLEFQARRTGSPEDHRREAGIPCVVTADALDHEGIVRAVADALHRVGANIVSLATEAYAAPVSGSPLFRMEARIDVPPGRTVADVRLSLEEVARSESIDIDARALARG